METGGTMENRDPAPEYAPCDDEDGSRYLGNRHEIEKILGSCNMTEIEKRTRAQITLQPERKINCVLEDTK